MIIDYVSVEKKDENFFKTFLKAQEEVYEKYEGVNNIQIRVKDLALKFEITVFHEPDPELKEASIVKIKKEDAGYYDGAEDRVLYYRTLLSVIGMDEEYLYLLER